MIILHRVAPEYHLYRWYSVHVQPTLLEPWAVVTAWGSLKSDYRRRRAIPCESREAAGRVALQIIVRKQTRGYMIHSTAGVSKEKGDGFQLDPREAKKTGVENTRC